MKDRGFEMISLLRNVHVGQHPITWVGHSKGGLFIKQILVHGIHFIQHKMSKIMIKVFFKGI